MEWWAALLLGVVICFDLGLIVFVLLSRINRD